jgi:hypothetical protein
MLNIEDVNILCAEISDEEAEQRAKLYADFIEEESMNEELLRQQQAMAHAADLENFSPFDTINS